MLPRRDVRVPSRDGRALAREVSRRHADPALHWRARLRPGLLPRPGPSCALSPGDERGRRAVRRPDLPGDARPRAALRGGFLSRGDDARVALHEPVEPPRAARGQRALGLHAGGPAGVHPDRGTRGGRRDGAAHRPGLRARDRVASAAPRSLELEARLMATPPLDDVKALGFDVFGTVVDWRSSIIREGKELGRAKGLDVDWEAFTDGWRGLYQPALDKVRTGAMPWTRLDDLHRMSLDRLLVEFEIRGLSEGEVDHLNRVWHRLDPWPDSVPGLTRLRKKYVLATLSNGNIALMVNMAKRAGLPWDAVLGAEPARAYKPQPEAYLRTADFLGRLPEECML